MADDIPIQALESAAADILALIKKGNVDGFSLRWERGQEPVLKVRTVGLDHIPAAVAHFANAAIKPTVAATEHTIQPTPADKRARLAAKPPWTPPGPTDEDVAAAEAVHGKGKA